MTRLNRSGDCAPTPLTLRGPGRIRGTPAYLRLASGIGLALVQSGQADPGNPRRAVDRLRIAESTHRAAVADSGPFVRPRAPRSADTAKSRLVDPWGNLRDDPSSSTMIPLTDTARHP
jgi:hypothetical protein